MPTVLLLERDPVRRHITGLILRHGGGYTVLEAGATPEAMTYARRYQIDIVVIEASTRDVYSGGRATAEQLRKIHPGLRFLFVSSCPRDLLVEKGFLELKDRFLARPFTPRVLLERLELLLAASAHDSSASADGGA